MKKILLFALATVLCASANAQLHKGRVLLGGSLSGQTSTSTYPGRPISVDSRSLGFSPSASYFYKENRSIGLALRYHQTKYFSDPVNESVDESYGASLGLNRYLPLGNNFFLAGHLSAGYTHGTTRNFYNNTRQSQSYSYYNVALQPGISYVAVNRLLLEFGLNSLAGISYSHASGLDANGQKSSSNTYSVYTSAGESNPFYVSFNILLGK
jgi:hypothetical protein